MHVVRIRQVYQCWRNFLQRQDERGRTQPDCFTGHAMYDGSAFVLGKGGSASLLQLSQLFRAVAPHARQ
jgi:hypothetical protein